MRKDKIIGDNNSVKLKVLKKTERVDSSEKSGICENAGNEQEIGLPSFWTDINNDVRSYQIPGLHHSCHIGECCCCVHNQKRIWTKTR